MGITLTLIEGLAEEIFQVTKHPLETAGVLLVRRVEDTDGNQRLLGVEYLPVPEAAYLRREVDSLGIASSGYVHALSKAEQMGAIAIWCHTHPGLGSIPRPSIHDDEVDANLSDLFQLRTNSGYYAALIASPSDNGFTFTGFLEDEGGHRSSIERIVIVGDRFSYIPSYNADDSFDNSLFDRNVRALGNAVQNALGNLKIGIVGNGGTGSAVAEQLVRLGVRKFTLIDPDHLSTSNVTRVYGSNRKDAGRPKVEVIADNLRGIASDATCRAFPSSIVAENIAKELVCCDFVFGCTDDNAGRLVLSRMATYLLIPVFDIGVLLSSDDDDQLVGINGRITTLIPGQACLICRGRIDTARAAAEMMMPEERKRLEDEGYAPALGRVEPAVVPYTTMVASIAVAELLERFIGYGPQPRPSEVLLRFHEREISTNIATSKPGHYCNPSSGKIGAGITAPFLGMTWAS